MRCLIIKKIERNLSDSNSAAILSLLRMTVSSTVKRFDFSVYLKFYVIRNVF